MTPGYQDPIKPEKIHSNKVYYVTDLNQCEKLWKNLITLRYVSDIWEFRLCFHKHFRHKPYFLVIEDHKGISGMVPLSYVENMDTYLLFPGEMWNKKTWLERMPVYTREDFSISDLLSRCPDNTYLRYLEIPDDSLPSELSEDEIGYVLYPGKMYFDIEQYYKRFSHKKFKAIKKVLNSFSDSGFDFFYNRIEDFDLLVEMNIQRYGRRSFLYNKKFRNSFMDVLYFLQESKMLRIVSCLINGELAAADIGAVFKGTYTVFMGGTNSRFPGIAKYMNMKHINDAFRENLNKIDFLCGDFHWKKLWHLDPETLYKYAPSISDKDSRVCSLYSSAQVISFN